MHKSACKGELRLKSADVRPGICIPSQCKTFNLSDTTGFRARQEASHIFSFHGGADPVINLQVVIVAYRARGLIVHRCLDFDCSSIDKKDFLGEQELLGGLLLQEKVVQSGKFGLDFTVPPALCHLHVSRERVVGLSTDIVYAELGTPVLSIGCFGDEDLLGRRTFLSGHDHGARLHEGGFGALG